MTDIGAESLPLALEKNSSVTSLRYVSQLSLKNMSILTDVFICMNTYIYVRCR